MPTPHISAEPGDFAEIILLPGDPLRAQHIADTFLEDVQQVTAVRNMFGFTGTYQGQRVSAMGTGMGIPSASIYAKELITEYGVKKLIRVGSCGGIGSDVGIRDVIIAMGACTDSGVNRARFRNLDFAAIADYQLLRAAVDAAEAKGKTVRVGNVFSADLFYHPDFSLFDTMEKMGVMAVEMEAAGLYGVAAEYGAQALAILTVSDHVRTGEATSSDERQSTFNDMIEIALEAALSL
ncbi:MAG TPA: purine-nucleoside phosphorylase [Acidimicrobiia bacterium]|nr:purine-nucleoside phosphorylase [Acidimicrobiia bacterium]